jgi:hypothetical protein
MCVTYNESVTKGHELVIEKDTVQCFLKTMLRTVPMYGFFDVVL